MAKPFIIMLDLDGPICTGRSKIGTGYDFDPVASGLIAKLCRDTGSSIVIISARRFDDYLISNLVKAGLAPYLFTDKDHWRTGGTVDGNRGDQVDAWHDTNPGHKYAIVDDDLTGYQAHHIQRLVHADPDTGLSLSDISKIKRLMANNTQTDGVKSDRITIANQALAAMKAIDQGDFDGARDILDIIANHPLAQ